MKNLISKKIKIKNNDVKGYYHDCMAYCATTCNNGCSAECAVSCVSSCRGGCTGGAFRIFGK
ncbi:MULTISPECIES: hypothetical protein [Haloimpatiens]|uniref:hypothetical protein n=1 Tax=Haloimpatiens TaxID=1755832 RepID=UPI000C82D03C|nr:MULTISPECIES: hypothetical protein [Haloimpatiens]